MYADKTKFPDFLRLVPYETSTPSSGATISSRTVSNTSAFLVPEAEELLKYTSFVPWETIDQDAVSCGTALQKLSTYKELRLRVAMLEHMNRKKHCSGPQQINHGLFTNAATAAREFNSLIDCVLFALSLPAVQDELLCEQRPVISWMTEYLSCSVHAASLKNENTDEENGDTEATSGSVTLPHTRLIKPDIILRDASKPRDEMPMINVAGKRPTLTIGKMLERTAPSLPTLQGKIQVLLQRVRDNVADLCEDERVLWFSISQAIVYALHTESGLSILTTFNETLFIRVCEAKLETNPETNASTPALEVAVSRIYDGDSVFCGLAACLKYVWSLDDHRSVEWEDRTRFVERLILEDESEEGSIGKRPLTGCGSSKGGKKMRTSISDTAQAGGTINIHHATDETGGSSSAILQSHSKELSSQVLYKLVSRNEGMIGKKGYNRVMKSRLGERPVAMKYFFTFEEKKVDSRISHEKDIFLLMETKSNGDYKDYVSSLVGYGKLKAFGMVLVTAYVGQWVHTSNSKLMVGEDVIEDTELLSEAAVVSLKRVHKLGVLHGDVALRNMRAEKFANGEWQIWWIDFGHARESMNRAAFVKEVCRCRYLFQRGKGPGKELNFV